MEDMRKIKIVCYNIRCIRSSIEESSNVESWESRKAHMIRYLLSQLPDVICLQEVKPLQLKDLKEGLGELYNVYSCGRDGDDKGEACPIFWLKSIVNDDSGTFWLSDRPEKAATTFKGATCNRICSYVALYLFSKKVYIFNTHFDNNSEEAQIKSSTLLMNKIPSIAGLYPSILSGDFNSGINGKPYNILCSSFYTDTRPLKYEIHTLPGFLRESKHFKLYNGSTIDFVFVSGFDVSSIEYKVDYEHDFQLHRDFKLRGMSDHRPLIVSNIKLK